MGRVCVAMRLGSGRGVGWLVALLALGLTVVVVPLLLLPPSPSHHSEHIRWLTAMKMARGGGADGAVACAQQTQDVAWGQLHTRRPV